MYSIVQCKVPDIQKAARDRVNPTIECQICGDYITKYNYSNHANSKKHMRAREAREELLTVPGILFTKSS
jgi:hypothetical protein